MTLRVRDLHVTYGRYNEPALSGVNLEVQPGEFVAVLGLSGAGKSTLIRAINRLVEPTHGHVFMGERELTALPMKELRRERKYIGMIFQSFHLVPRMRVKTNVLLGAVAERPAWQNWIGYFKPELIKRAEEQLRSVGLYDWRHQRAEQLSGGQQQRVAIARAMMQQPCVLLGDEPVSNLDPVTSRSILQLLRDWHDRDQLITLINLHDVSLARRFATRIIGLSGGRIVFDGPPEALTVEEEDRIYAAN